VVNCEALAISSTKLGSKWVQ